MKVYFTDLNCSYKNDVFKKIRRVTNEMSLHKKISGGALVAVKLHFGEMGNLAFLNPLYAREIVDIVKGAGGKPYLTDTNTLYRGKRKNAPSHLENAYAHGFSPLVMGAPVYISGGLMGDTCKEIAMNGEENEKVYSAEGIYNADFLVILSHFKFHEVAGFGGALKNAGMGCAPVRGKLAMHSFYTPYVMNSCVGCAKCVKWCHSAAISLVEKRAFIDPEKCVGCGICIGICPDDHIRIRWSEKTGRVGKSMMEYAAGILRDFKGRAFYMNFLEKISPQCDCYPFSDNPVVEDIGILASYDPVALDAASIDLVNAAAGRPCSELEGIAAGQDKIAELYPDVKWKQQLAYAEKLGLGTRAYTLVDVR